MRRTLPVKLIPLHDAWIDLCAIPVPVFGALDPDGGLLMTAKWQDFASELGEILDAGSWPVPSTHPDYDRDAAWCRALSAVVAAMSQAWGQVPDWADDWMEAFYG